MKVIRQAWQALWGGVHRLIWGTTGAAVMLLLLTWPPDTESRELPDWEYLGPLPVESPIELVRKPIGPMQDCHCSDGSLPVVRDNRSKPIAEICEIASGLSQDERDCLLQPDLLLIAPSIPRLSPSQRRQLGEDPESLCGAFPDEADADPVPRKGVL